MLAHGGLICNVDHFGLSVGIVFYARNEIAEGGIEMLSESGMCRNM